MKKTLLITSLAFASVCCWAQDTLSFKDFRYVGANYIPTLNKSFVNKAMVFAKNTDTVTGKADESNTIVYFLQDDVTSLLEKELQRVGDSVYFELEKEKDEDYRITMVRISPKNNEFWRKVTNRKIYINRKLYPLVFDYDWDFATTDSGAEILKRASETEYFDIGKALSTHHYSFYVLFNRYGAVIKTGYDIPQ